ncbi:MAG: YihY/virulence factor BrkB family protein [Deltaproteobacteria bacterium]|nr:YihY/virulence factor BrkB family protein [Deltaproteobacteria bacterium]
MVDILALKAKIIDFIRVDIWRIRVKDIPRTRYFFIKQLRILLLATRGFAKDKCPLSASALTFYSILSVVPIVAMAFGIAKGFGFQVLLEKQLMEKFPGQEEVMNRVVAFAHSLLENTKGGMIAGIGILFLLWTVIKLLSHIERSFNDIWEVKTPRNYGRKFSDYLSIMLISPILFILSSSVTVFITTQIAVITQKVALIGMFSPVIFFMLKLIPYCLIWILFIFMYMLMPNTRINFSSGLIAGVIAGTIYQIAQWAYITFQVGMARYNAIYGSFAALPLFLIWIQLSWLIVLFGAEISFAYQYVDTYDFEPDRRFISPAFKKLLSLQISRLIISTFLKAEPPLSAFNISKTLEIPIRLAQQILDELVEAGILSDTEIKKNKEASYQPARDINAITINSVVEALEQKGTDNIPVAQTAELKYLSEALKTLNDEIEKSPANRLLKDI